MASLAKSLGAQITVVLVEEPFDWLRVLCLEELAKRAPHIKKHAHAHENSGTCLPLNDLVGPKIAATDWVQTFKD